MAQQLAHEQTTGTTATFTLTQPVDIPAPALAGTASDITLVGDLELHGVKKSVSVPAKAQLANGTISVAVDSGPEGDKAKTIADQYALTPIGRATGVTVRVTNDVQPFHELSMRAE